MNAGEAMPSGGSLFIRTRVTSDSDAPDSSHVSENGSVQIVFQDTGIGIPPEVIGKVFDPFFTSKGVGQGTGLGLAVSYGIIERHGGTIVVESAPDKGTTFTITLPVGTVS